MSSDPQPADDETPKNPYFGGELGAGIDWADPNSKLAPFYMSAGGVVAVGLLGLVFLLFAVVRLEHTDFWAHLKYGEWIAANQQLPEHEPFTPFADQDAPFFDSLWLSQLMYHGVFELGRKLAGGEEWHQFAGGVELIRIVHLFAAIATLGFLALAYRRVADSVPWGILGMLLVLVLIMSPLTIQRPQAFGITCFAALLCGVSRPLVSRAFLFWVPLLFVAWANLHGSFVVGIGLLGAVMLGRVVEVMRAEGWSLKVAWADLAVKRLLITLAISVIAVAVLNPHGPLLYWKIVQFAGHPNLGTMLEWQPLEFTLEHGGHWGYVATLVLLVGSRLIGREEFTTTRWILILTLGVWPVLQQRAMVWWVAVLPWIIGPSVVSAAERWGVRAKDNTPDLRRTVLTAFLVVFIVWISPITLWLRKGEPRPLNEAIHPGTPIDVAAALNGQPPANPDRVKPLTQVIQNHFGGRYTGPVFTSEVLGDYLLWALPADTPVMMYNHAQAFTEEYWSKCLAAQEANPGWKEFFDEHGVGAVVMEVDLYPKLYRALQADPDWAVVLDESTNHSPAPRSRLFVALRKP